MTGKGTGTLTETDVLIVGAGPTGLTAATLLARYGVKFRIIDKNAAAAEKSRALGVQARTLELWDKLGLAEGAVARGQALQALNLITKGTVDEGGRPFIALGRDGKDISPYPYLLIHEQNKTEKMLLADLAAQIGPKGAYGVERGTEIVGLVPAEDKVTVVLRHEDEQRETVEAKWLIAADGASSFVRKTLALEFDGATYADPLFVADVDLEWPLSRDKFYAQVPRQGMLTFFPMRGDGYSDNQYRIIARIPRELESKDELTGEDIQQILDKHSVVRAKITATRWVSKYRIHRRMTRAFRVGRVFLAGDAAHIHSPAGGQGMNTGIQDAWKLAWKLALVVKGQAAEELLESYELERIPVAKAVLNGSDKGFSFIGSPNYVFHLLRSALLPRLTSLASRESVGKGIFKFLSQTWINYRKSPAVGSDKGAKRVKPGDRAPYARFTLGESVYSLLHGVDHHLLLFAGRGADVEAERARAEAQLNDYGVTTRVHVVGAKETALREAYGVDEPSAFLVRPDGHVAWRGAVSLDDLASYMDRFYTRCTEAEQKTAPAQPKFEVAV